MASPLNLYTVKRSLFAILLCISLALPAPARPYDGQLYLSKTFEFTKEGVKETPLFIGRDYPVNESNVGLGFEVRISYAKVSANLSGFIIGITEPDYNVTSAQAFREKIGHNSVISNTDLLDVLVFNGSSYGNTTYYEMKLVVFYLDAFAANISVDVSFKAEIESSSSELSPLPTGYVLLSLLVSGILRRVRQR